MFSSATEDSHHENHIFIEVFFRKDTEVISKRSLISSLKNSEYEDSKIVDMSLCFSSENSTVTSQCSFKSSLVEDSEFLISMRITVWLPFQVVIKKD